MRPTVQTGAHQTHDLAELVCSNSLGSNLPDRASGVLKNEAADRWAPCCSNAPKPRPCLPAARWLLTANSSPGSSPNGSRIIPNIEIVREEVKEIPNTPTIIASGPLTSPALSQSIARLSGEEHLFFFDAIAPVIHADSINMEIAFRASRYGTGEQDEGDYINCPFTKEEYYAFVDALLHGRTHRTAFL